MPNSYHFSDSGNTKQYLFLPSSDLSYVLGAYLGDGNIRTEKRKNSQIYRLRFLVKDFDFISTIKKSLENILQSSKIKPNLYQRNKYFALDTCSVIICKTLKNKGFINKCIELYPSFFLRGIYDAEGSISEYLRDRTPRITFSNTNYSIILLVSKLLNKLGIDNKVNVQYEAKSEQNRKKCFRISIHKQNAVKNFTKSVGFSINRKQDKLERYLIQYG